MLYVDISILAQFDQRTGIQRVVRAILSQLMSAPSTRHNVLPVYLTDEGGGWHYRVARQYAETISSFASGVSSDRISPKRGDWLRRFARRYVKLTERVTPSVSSERVRPTPGDWLLGLDWHGGIVSAENGGRVYTQWRSEGGRIAIVVYDLLPILRPEWFPPGADVAHARWFETAATVSDRLICISQSVALDVKEWLQTHLPQTGRELAVGHFSLGADIGGSLPSKGVPPEADALLAALRLRPTFLAVGTVEPRKGYLQLLASFEQLWASGTDTNLVIVGHEGWTGVPARDRRTIPTIVSRLRHHAANGNRLFWLEGVSDEYLQAIYQAASCLIAASEGEGFGIPLIEASTYDLPIIARDIPVFARSPVITRCTSKDWSRPHYRIPYSDG